MADKLRTQQQLEALQNKFVGTGHADTTKHEWTGNIARDSAASYQGHAPLLHLMAIAMGTCVERVRMRCMESMVLPVGLAPRVWRDDDEDYEEEEEGREEEGRVENGGNEKGRRGKGKGKGKHHS